MAAMACLLMLVVRVPVMPLAPFLTYDPKDVIVVIGGFMFGPWAAVTIAVISAFVEMFFSETWLWGFVMNVTSSLAFAVPAALIYKFRRTLGGAIAGLAVGVAVVVPVMLAMNVLVVPLFMPFVERADVIGMLAGVFLPFNAIKYGLNAAFALVVYKPIIRALRAAGLLQVDENSPAQSHFVVMLVASLVIVGLAITIIIMQVTP